MKLNSKIRLRLLASAIFLTGATVFLSGQPSRLPEAEVAAARADYERWQERHNDDIRHGRPSSAGPAPQIDTRTGTNKALVFMGFALCLVSILVLTQSFM